MDRKQKKFTMELKTILGMYGVPYMMRDEFLDRFLDAIKGQMADQILGYSKQLAKDAFIIMMHNRGHGRKKCMEMLEEYLGIFDEFDLMAECEAIDNFKNGNVEEDGIADIVWTKDQIDRAVKPIYGDEFLPYDQRYHKAQDEEQHHDLSELKKIADATY